MRNLLWIQVKYKEKVGEIKYPKAQKSWRDDIEKEVYSCISNRMENKGAPIVVT